MWSLHVLPCFWYTSQTWKSQSLLRNLIGWSTIGKYLIATFLADSSVGLWFDSHFIFFNQIKLQCDIHCSNKHHGNFNFKNILFHCVKIICQLLLWVTSCFKWRPKSEWYGPKFFFYKYKKCRPAPPVHANESGARISWQEADTLSYGLFIHAQSHKQACT